MPKWLLPALAVALIAAWLLIPTSSGVPESTEMSSSTESIQAELPAANTAEPPPQPEQPLGRFLEEASLAMVLRSPETITSLGIGPMVGVRDDQLTPLSMEYEVETVALLDSLLAQLSLYDLASASSEDALSAQVYGWFLQDQLDSYRYSDHDYLVSSFIHSYPDVIERHLTRSHPIRSLANAEDYISRLQQISLRFDELIVRLEASVTIGAIPPAFILQDAAEALQQTGETAADESNFYTTFAHKLQSVPSISDSRKLALEGQVLTALTASVLPAYVELAEAVSSLVERADDSIGVWRHENGDRYYAHQLRKYTTTDLSAEEIHAIGLVEVERVQSEIRQAAAELGLDPEASLTILFDELSQQYGIVTGSDTVVACREIIEQIVPLVQPEFASWPGADIEVIEGGTNAYFTPGTFDGTRPGRFTAPAGREEPLFSLATLTYHEAVPGHGLQTAFAYAADIPNYRAGLGFTAYAEGWALYAERLAWELGAYDSNPVGNLGRLQAELFRAARLVVDTGIHAQRWTMDEAIAYMLENTGLDEAFVRQQVERYIVLPGQATAYKIGMLEIMKLRDQAQEALGDSFTLPGFHEAILGEGDVPLPILPQLVDAYIERTQ